MVLFLQTKSLILSLSSEKHIIFTLTKVTIYNNEDATTVLHN